MNTILNITRKTLLNEVAGISFIVREWAKILEQEVREQNETHRETELQKMEKETPTKTAPKKSAPAPKTGKKCK